jgi:hypothetical protein
MIVRHKENPHRTAKKRPCQHAVTTFYQNRSGPAFIHIDRKPASFFPI